jgi:hypothetical protein
VDLLGIQHHNALIQVVVIDVLTVESPMKSIIPKFAGFVIEILISHKMLHRLHRTSSVKRRSLLSIMDKLIRDLHRFHPTLVNTMSLNVNQIENVFINNLPLMLPVTVTRMTIRLHTLIDDQNSHMRIGRPI